MAARIGCAGGRRVFVLGGFGCVVDAKRPRPDDPGPSSSQVQPSPSSLERQRQESILSALQLYVNPQEAGIKLLLPQFMDLEDNPLTLCPTETLATQCLHCKWAPFSVFGQLLDSLPSTQDQRHTSPSIIQP